MRLTTALYFYCSQNWTWNQFVSSPVLFGLGRNKVLIYEIKSKRTSRH